MAFAREYRSAQPEQRILTSGSMSLKASSKALEDPGAAAKMIANTRVQSAKDLIQLNIMLQTAGIPEAFEPLTKEFGVEFLRDVELLVDADIEALTSLSIIKRRKLKLWVHSRRRIQLDTRPGVELVCTIFVANSIRRKNSFSDHPQCSCRKIIHQ
jgi:hypothetical protein